MRFRWMPVPRRVLLLALALASGAGCRQDAPARPGAEIGGESEPRFRELTGPVFPSLIHRAVADDQYFMPDIMGSGAALLDYDADGDLDLFCLSVRAEGSEGPFGHRLLQQTADRTWVDVTRGAGLESSAYGVGVAVGDIDNDGDLDLYVTCFGPDQLWRNNGDGTFVDITESAGIRSEHWGTAASFVDVDRDGWLDLFVVNYLDYDPAERCDDGSGRPDYCGPASFAGAVDRLYMNTAGNTQAGSDASGKIRFVERTVEAGLTLVPGRGLGGFCQDLTGDGRPDLFVANDREANALWVQQEDGRFLDEAVLRGVAYNRLGQAEANMGIAAGDFDGNGTLDLFVTHLRGESNTLFAGQEGGYFQDATTEAGVGPASFPFTGFGTAAVDIEHDGDLDLLVVNGRVKRAPPDPGVPSGFWAEYAEANQVYVNEGIPQAESLEAGRAAASRFRNLDALGGPFARRQEVSRALAYGDIDNDGDLDLVVTNVGGPVRLYKSDAAETGNWLMLRVLDPERKRDAIGAEVLVRAGERSFRRVVNPSSSYLTAHDMRVHIGLGASAEYDEVEVVWPDGLRQRFSGGPANVQRTLERSPREAGEARDPHPPQETRKH